MESTPPTRRRWLQFGLGTLLLLITAAAIGAYVWSIWPHDQELLITESVGFDRRLDAEDQARIQELNQRHVKFLVFEQDLKYQIALKKKLGTHRYESTYREAISPTEDYIESLDVLLSSPYTSAELNAAYAQEQSDQRKQLEYLKVLSQ